MGLEGKHSESEFNKKLSYIDLYRINSSRRVGAKYAQK